jgi:hypothetical protein
MGVDLAAMAVVVQWSPRATFPPSQPLDDRLFSCGDGVYLMTNPRFGESDPVRAVGWAESDYWAVRVWSYPRFEGDLDAPTAQCQPVPSLAALGCPDDLSYGSVRAFEVSQPGARKGTVLTAQYRMTDGAFLCASINGVRGVRYVYASNHPGSDDQPVALEVKLHPRTT